MNTAEALERLGDAVRCVQDGSIPSQIEVNRMAEALNVLRATLTDPTDEARLDMRMKVENVMESLVDGRDHAKMMGDEGLAQSYEDDRKEWEPILALIVAPRPKVTIKELKEWYCHIELFPEYCAWLRSLGVSVTEAPDEEKSVEEIDYRAMWNELWPNENEGENRPADSWLTERMADVERRHKEGK